MKSLIRLTCLAAIVCLGQLVAAGQHEFRFRKPDAQSVSVMGEFNAWKGKTMTKGSDGTWTARVSLPPGTYGYKFLVNGSDWTLDPENSNRKTVDGVENSAVEIKEGDRSTPRPLATATPARSVATRPAAAGDADRARFDFNVLAERKRFDFERSGNKHTVTTKETWGYKVTLENKSFAPVSELEVQYRQFKLDDTLRGSRKLIGVAGSTNVATLGTAQKLSFETLPMEIEKLELRPGWFYNDDAKEKVKDRLAGLWLRILRNGEIVFEWQNPPDLKNSAKWE